MALIKRTRLTTLAERGTSSVASLGSETLVGFFTPEDLTAQQVKVQVSPDGERFYDLYEGDAPLKIPVAPNAYIPLDPSKLLGASYLRLAHLDGSGSPVDEATERFIIPVFRAFS